MSWKCYLHVIGDHASVHCSPAGSHGGAQLVCHLVQHPEVLSSLHAATPTDDNLGTAQIRSVRLTELLTNKLGVGGQISGGWSVLQSTRATSSSCFKGCGPYSDDLRIECHQDSLC